MKNQRFDASINLKSELAGYVSDGTSSFDTPGLTELDGLLRYLDDTYPDDEVLEALVWRTWKAATVGTAAPSQPVRTDGGLLQAELTRTEMWAIYLEAKGDPRAPSVRRLWNGLTACFNPHTNELEEGFIQDEARTLCELQDKYGKAPEGEPYGTFN